MEAQLKILMVEDVPADAELAQRELLRAGIASEMVRVDTEQDFLARMRDLKPDVIISDYSLPQFHGKAVLDLAQRHSPDTPFIFVSGTIGEEVAVESLKRGATDYIIKGNLKRLPSAVTRAVEQARELAARRKAERSLEETQKKFSLFMQYLPGIAVMKDLDGRVTFANQVFERKTGVAITELIGHTDDEFRLPEVARRVREHDRRVIETEKMLEVIEVIPQSDGEHSWLVSRFPIYDTDGNLIQIGITGVDLTDRLRAEQKVARLSRIYSFLSGINSTIARMRDREELLQETCRIAVQHGGFKLAWVGLLDEATHDVRPMVWVGGADDFIAGILMSARDDLRQGRDVVGNVIRSGKPFVVNDISSHPQMQRVQDSIKHGLLAVIGLPLSVENETVGVLTLYAEETGVFDQKEIKLLVELAGDVSFALEYLHKKDRLDYLAYFDPLTTLPNRTLFCDHVNNLARARADQKMAVLMLNLGRFAAINDTLGRQVGDALLKQVAERLRDAVGKADEVARVGGDTFTLCVVDVKDIADIAHILQEQVYSLLSRPFMVEGHELRLSFKCGVALFPGDGSDAETLLKNAEAALKKARSSGDSYLFYAPQMNARVAELLSLENKLRAAVAERQFVLHYQPCVDLKTNRMTGMEALMRWNSPELGLIEPARFIPILEETGLIMDAGTWALEKAMSDYRRWVEKDMRPLRIAVNISALQLRQKNFTSLIEKAFEKGNGGLFHLDLEITESVIMEDIERYIPKLLAIKEMGVGIAIDDFGTGYSSLSYLAKLPVTALKIDRSFIDGMVINPDSMAIVSTIISLAHALNLKVIAEGVEAEDQLQLLKRLKCDEIQGFLFSRPRPPDEVEKIFNAGKQLS